MNVKIRHKLIEIEDCVSDRFVILITNYRWLLFQARFWSPFSEKNTAL